MSLERVPKDVNLERASARKTVHALIGILPAGYQMVCVNGGNYACS